MKKILNKIISIFTSAVISASVLFGIPLSEFNGLAAGVSAASTMTESDVQARINTLLKYFKDGDSFTDNGNDSCTCKDNSGFSLACNHCHLHNIWDNNPILKAHPELKLHKPGGGNSCNGFAKFVFQYLFGNNESYTVQSKTLTSKIDWSKLKKGDLLKFTRDGSSATHYAIFVSYNSSSKTVKLYESNAHSKSGRSNMITYRDTGISFSGFKTRQYVEVFRNPKMVSGEEGIGEHYIVDKNYDKNDPKNIRASNSSSSALLGTIPKNTVCWVTDISGSGSSRWGKVTYGGVTGYINLYYSVTTSEHQWGGWSTSKAATCTASGTQKRTCGCGKAEEKTIAAKGHSYGSWQTAAGATCTAAGTEQRVCSSCGNKETRSTTASGHTYKSETIAPGCTEGGCTKYTCTKCGYSYSNNSTPAAGHKYKDEAIAGGGTKHTCTVCGHSYTDGSAQKPYDVNNDGRITAVDARWILQDIVGLRKLTPAQKAVADVNGDGRISAVDARWILQSIVGLRKLG